MQSTQLPQEQIWLVSVYGQDIMPRCLLAHNLIDATNAFMQQAYLCISLLEDQEYRFVGVENDPDLEGLYLYGDGQLLASMTAPGTVFPHKDYDPFIFKSPDCFTDVAQVLNAAIGTIESRERDAMFEQASNSWTVVPFIKNSSSDILKSEAQSVTTTGISKDRAQQVLKAMASVNQWVRVTERVAEEPA